MSSAALRWTFGSFVVDPANACLWRGTEAVALSPKAFDVLPYLVQHPNRVVTKDELLDAVWPETAVTDARARQLCEQLDDTQQLFSVLVGLWRSAHVQAQLQTARALGEQLVSLAKGQGDSALLVEAHGPLGQTLCMQGEPILAREHLNQIVTLYEPHRHSALVFHVGYDPGVSMRRICTV